VPPVAARRAFRRRAEEVLTDPASVEKNVKGLYPAKPEQVEDADQVTTAGRRARRQAEDEDLLDDSTAAIDDPTQAQSSRYAEGDDDELLDPTAGRRGRRQSDDLNEDMAEVKPASRQSRRQAEDPMLDDDLETSADTDLEDLDLPSADAADLVGSAIMSDVDDGLPEELAAEDEELPPAAASRQSARSSVRNLRRSTASSTRGGKQADLDALIGDMFTLA
jgi:hypothetical protein